MQWSNGHLKKSISWGCEKDAELHSEGLRRYKLSFLLSSRMEYKHRASGRLDKPPSFIARHINDNLLCWWWRFPATAISILEVAYCLINAFLKCSKATKRAESLHAEDFRQSKNITERETESCGFKLRLRTLHEMTGITDPTPTLVNSLIKIDIPTEQKPLL